MFYVKSNQCQITHQLDIGVIRLNEKLTPSGQSTLLWTAALAGTDMFFLGFNFFEVILFVGFLTLE